MEVNFAYRVNFAVAHGAQDLDEHALVGADTADGVVQLFGIKLRYGRHERDDQVLEVATQLAL